MTFFAPSGPRTTGPAVPKCAEWFEALCPCGSVAVWRAAATASSDLSATRVDYVIDCDCPARLEEIA